MMSKKYPYKKECKGLLHVPCADGKTCATCSGRAGQESRNKSLYRKAQATKNLQLLLTEKEERIEKLEAALDDILFIIEEALR